MTIFLKPGVYVEETTTVAPHTHGVLPGSANHSHTTVSIQQNVFDGSTIVGQATSTADVNWGMYGENTGDVSVSCPYIPENLPETPEQIEKRRRDKIWEAIQAVGAGR